MPAHDPFEVLERDHYDSDVVEGLPHKTVFQNPLYSEACELVHTDVMLDLFSLSRRVLTS